MSIFIEQDRDQSRLAFELQSRADLDAIRLIELTAMSTLAPEDAPFPLQFLMKFKADDATVIGSRMTVPIKFAFKAVTEDEKTEVVMIGCRLEAVYDLAEGFAPTESQIEAFKEGNAIFNCWTYFREVVQNTVSRMNYPPVTLPFLRMKPKAVESKESSELKPIEGTGQATPKIEPQAEQAPPLPQKRRIRKGGINESSQ